MPDQSTVPYLWPIIAGLLSVVLLGAIAFIVYLKRKENIYHSLFNDAEISLWCEDFSVVINELQALRKQGIEDLRSYLKENEKRASDLADKVKVKRVNRASVQLFGASNEDELLNSIEDVFGEGALDIFIEELCAIWDGKKIFRSEAKHKTLKGQDLDVILSMPIPSQRYGFKCIPVSILDISAQKRSQQTIWRQANHDSLTQLANRNMFSDRLRQEIIQFEQSGHAFTLLFLDLDQFKEVNDKYGHLIGDMLLIETARRLKKCVRDADLIGRWGGDEFCILLPSMNTPASIDRICETIVNAIDIPYVLNEQFVHVSASIGITRYPSDTQKYETLLKYADQAMYASKNKGGNTYVYHDTED